MSTEHLKCTLCESQAKRRLSDGALSFAFCDVCIGAFCDPKSAPGRVLCRAAKSVIRRIARRLHADKYDTPEHREHCRRNALVYKAKPENKRKALARSAVTNAMRHGTLIRPEACSRCGDRPEKLGRQCQIWFHHTHGYDKENWLKGEWLCRHCHLISEPSPNKGMRTKREMYRPSGEAA